MIAATVPTPRFPLTPGAYLKARRCAALLSVADVAERLACDPRIAAHERAGWLDMIEADVQPASYDTICALAEVFPFDQDVLHRLGEIAIGADAPYPQLCRICACSDADACPGSCFWAEPGLCSTCFDPASHPAIAARAPIPPHQPQAAAA